jgi:hypothetical protein
MFDCEDARLLFVHFNDGDRGTGSILSIVESWYEG